MDKKYILNDPELGEIELIESDVTEEEQQQIEEKIGRVIEEATGEKV